MQGFFCGTKGFALCDDDGFYDDFNMDEGDLNIENYEEYFGADVDNTGKLFDNDGIDALFATKDMSCSNCHSASAAEVIPSNGSALSSLSLCYCDFACSSFTTWMRLLVAVDMFFHHSSYILGCVWDVYEMSE